MTSWAMMSGSSNNDGVALPGGPRFETMSDFVSVSAGWVEEMKIPLLDGARVPCGRRESGSGAGEPGVCEAVFRRCESDGTVV